MSNFSDQSQPPVPQKSSAGSCIAYGCLGLLAIPMFGAIALTGNGGFLAFLVVAAFIIFVIVKSRKINNAPDEPANVVTIAESKMAERLNTIAEQAGVYTPPLVPNSSLEGEYGSPMCNHRFTAKALETATVTCDCGYTYKSADLIQLEKLEGQLQTLESRIANLIRQIREGATAKPASVKAAAASAAPASVVAEPVVTPVVAPAPVAKPKPVKPKAQRPKVNVSLQQWLIIGAAVLVMIAASVFVANGLREGWPAEAFAGVTLGLSVLMAFATFRFKNISVVLTNFTAAFSASMITASMMILGDQLSADFMWNTAPAWWWAVSLAIVSLSATGLARFSGNFGFKAIGLLTSALAVAILTIGVIFAEWQMPADLYGVYVAGLSLTAVGVLYQAKFLLGIKRAQVTDKNFKAYAKQLADREDTALRNLSVILAGGLAVIGMGMAVIQAASNILKPANAFGLLSITAVWVLLGLSTDTWSRLLSKDGKPANFAKPLASGMVVISATAAAVSLASLIPLPLASHLVAFAALAVITWFGGKLGKLAPNALLADIAMWFGAATYALWVFVSATNQNAVLLLGLALVLTVRDLRNSSSRYQIASVAIASAGFAVLAFESIANQVAPVDSAIYALLTIGLAVATNVTLVVQGWLAKRNQSALHPATGFIALGFAAAITLVLQYQVHLVPDMTLERELPFIASYLLYSVASLVLSRKLNFALAKQLLTAHAYLGQLVTVVAIANALARFGADAIPTATWLLGALALINYGFGWLTRSTAQLQVGFGIALIAFFANQTTQLNGAFALNLQLAVVALAAIGHVVIWQKRIKPGNAVVTLVIYLSIGLGLIVSLALNAFGLLGQSYAQLLSVNIFLSVLAVAALVVFELANRKKNAWVASVATGLALIYSVLSLALNMISTQDGDLLRYRALLTTVVFAVVAHRLFAAGKLPVFMVLAYAGNIFSALLLGALTQSLLITESAPEAFSIWIALSLALTSWFIRKDLGKAREVLLLDIPVLVVALSSLAYAFTQGTEGNENLVRGLIASLALAGYSYWRSAKQNLWLVGGYLFGASSAIWLAQSIHVWFNFTFEGPEGFTILLAISVLLGNRVLVRRIKGVSTELRWGAIVAILALPSLFWSLASDLSLIENQMREILSLALIAVFAQLMLKRAAQPIIWVAVGYLTNVATFAAIAQSSYSWFKLSFDGPEIFSIAIVAAILLSNQLMKNQIAATGDVLRFTIPTALLTLPSLAYSFVQDPTLGESHLRRLLALAVISGYTLWSVNRAKQPFAWVIGSYVSVTATSTALASALYQWFAISFQGPEIYSIAIVAAIMLSNQLMKKQIATTGDVLRFTIPTALLTLPSLAYSFVQDPTLGESHLRRLLALAVISGYTLWSVNRAKQPFAWVIGSYVSVTATSLALVSALYQWFAISFDGPEIFSVVITAGIVLTRRLTREKLKVQGSLFNFGLPLAVLLVPSTLFTYASLQVAFNDLTALQVTRVISVLVASAALLVLGIRRGNLASTAIGLLGLALVLIPGTATHSNEVIPGIQAESTALVAGILIFVLLTVLHQRKILKGNSAIYIGIPVTIALAPALLNSLVALGNPTLGSTDWWRFGIILAAGLTLLIVGSLRELAGMFYPGLAAVLLSALPYGFKQTQDQAWFLWVLLLLVAGVMVWVAVRLEQIKKAGRSSTAWLKELK